MKIKLLETYVGQDKVVVEKVATGIAFIIWDAKRKVAGATHIFSSKDEDIERMIRELVQKLGLNDKDFVSVRVKFAGGADVPGLSIGKRMVNTVVSVVKKLGLPVGGYDVGGHVTRDVFFDPKTGICEVRYLIGGKNKI